MFSFESIHLDIYMSYLFKYMLFTIIKILCIQASLYKQQCTSTTDLYLRDVWHNLGMHFPLPTVHLACQDSFWCTVIENLFMLCKIRHVRIEFDSPLSLLLAFQESAVNLCETGPLFSVPPPAAQHELVNWVGAAGWLGQIHLERYKRGKSQCILLYYSIVCPLSHSLCLFSCINLL